MPLALTVDSLETVPEALRGAYVADGDKFKLDAELPDVTGLKNTVTATRAERDAAKAATKAWEKLGKSPDELATLLAEIEAEGTEKLKKKGDTEAILKQKQDAWDKEKSGLVGERDNALSAARKAIVDSNVLGALTKAKASTEGATILPRILGERVKFDFVDGEPVYTIMQADGKTPMAGSSADGAATYDDLVKDAVKAFPSLFEGSGNGGGGTPPKGGKPGDKTITRADFDKLGPLERAAKLKTHKLVD